MAPLIGSGLSQLVGLRGQSPPFDRIGGLGQQSAQSRQELAYQCLTDITLQAAQAREDSHAFSTALYGPDFFGGAIGLNKSFKEKLQDEINDWLRGE